MSDDADKARASLLEDLLHAEEPRQLQAYRAKWIRDDNVTVGDLAKARRQLIELCEALAVGSLPGKRVIRTLETATPTLSDTRASDTDADHDLERTAEMAWLDSDPTPRTPRTGTKPSEGVPLDALDIDKYAVLCAWSEVHPERRDALHAQYGLPDEAARRALDARMEERFMSDAPLRVAFAQRLRMHLGFLRRA